MISIVIKVILLAAIALFVLNGSDFHMCSDDEHHDNPVCEDCSCLLCSSSLTGMDILNDDFHVEYILSENLILSDYNIKIDEIVFELDQPPKV